MRPNVDRDGHLDAETVAGLDAEVFDTGTAARLTVHLGSCARCTAELRGLRELRHQLAVLPAPAMPAAVAARLEAVIRAEQHQRAEQQRRDAGAHRYSGPAPAVARHGQGPAQPLQQPGSNVVDLAARRRRNRFLAVAAGVAVLGVGTIVTLSATGGGQAGHGHAVAGNVNEPPTAATQPAPSSGGQGGASPKEGAPKTGAATPGPGSGAPVEYRTGPQIEQNVETVIRSGLLADIRPGDTASAAGAMADPQRRRACLTSALGSGATDPIAVQQISFAAKRSYVFVFPSTPAQKVTDMVRVVVVPSECGTPAANLGATLFDGTTPR